jgi:glycine cleavage system H protein
MSTPEDNRYAKSHEYVHVEGDIGTIGITEYAQKELGDVVFVELPEEGRTLEAGEAFGAVESVKAVSDLYSPLAGEVVEVNESLGDNPEKINEDPYGEGWILKLRVSGEADLLSAEDYEKLLEESE